MKPINAPILTISRVHGIVTILLFRTAPFKCAVISCKNAFENYDTAASLPCRFHKFPANDPLHLVKWLSQCGVPPDFRHNDSMVCSNHFELADYNTNYKQEVLDPKYQRTLKHSAVPSQHLDGPEAVTVESGNASDEQEEAEAPGREEILEALDQNKFMKRRLAELQVLCHQAIDKKTQCELRVYARKSRFEVLRKAADKLDKDYKYKVLEHRHRQRNLLALVFSNAQIKLLQRNRKVVWSNDDMAMAFTMRHMGGKSCYLYLKNTLKYPLPSLSCVQKWAASYKNN